MLFAEEAGEGEEDRNGMVDDMLLQGGGSQADQEGSRYQRSVEL